MSKELEMLEELIDNHVSIYGEADLKDVNRLSDDIKKALQELETLRKKETPMKWIEVEDETGYYDECPVCHYPSYNDLGHNHYCTVCGQRLE